MNPPPNARTETLPAGGMWSRVIPRGQALRLIDPQGGANVSALFYNADLPLERYNMPDTLKAQHVAFLTSGRVLYSDMGRILLSVTEDTCGWHDTLCGHTTRAMIESRYGAARYQEHRNDFHRNARDNFLVELGKWGLGKRDLAPNVNFFSKVTANEGGRLAFTPGHSRAGASVTLRAEMNVLAVLTACPHPLDPSPTYQPRPIDLQLFPVDPPGPEDPCRVSRPENGRGFLNTESLFL